MFTCIPHTGSIAFPGAADAGSCAEPWWWLWWGEVM
jgi:hypothetical protein